MNLNPQMSIEIRRQWQAIPFPRPNYGSFARGWLHRYGDAWRVACEMGDTSWENYHNVSLLMAEEEEEQPEYFDGGML